MRGFLRLSLLLLLLPFTAGAEVLHITPSVNPSVETKQEITANQGIANGTVNGRGDRLHIIYSSASDIIGNVVSVRSDGRIDVQGFLSFTLPSGLNQEAIIDLTVARDWSPFASQYYLTFTKKDAAADTNFHEIAVLPATFSSMGRAAFSQLISPEPYQVAAHHMVRGYYILGSALSAILGLAVLIGFVFALKRRSSQRIIAVVVIGLFIYSMRFGIDLVYFAVTNISAWYGDEIIAHAGSMADVGERMKTQKNATLFVCDDATDYFMKMARYFAYPTPVLREIVAGQTTHVLVVQKANWSFDETMLRCGSINAPARLLETYPDGAQLFELQS